MKKQKTRYSGIGGQAVLEGVMMRNHEKYAVAVRRTDGRISVDVEEYRGARVGRILRKIPFLRGIFVFADSLALGMRAINISADYFEEEGGDEKDNKAEKSGSGAGDRFLSILVTLLSFAIAIAAFMLLPYFLASIFRRFIAEEGLIAVIEGVMRIAIFVIYVLLISLMKDIRRLFAYHGAEHKCINCIESGKPLTVENARRSTRLHKRCGSSFLIFVMLVSIVLFFFIRTETLYLRLLLRILLIPVIAGISYELIYLAGHTDFFLVRLLSAPGLWLQRLTTKEPDNEMIEVGIAAVEAVFDWKQYLSDAYGLTAEELNAAEPADDTDDDSDEEEIPE